VRTKRICIQEGCRPFRGQEGHRSKKGIALSRTKTWNPLKQSSPSEAMKEYLPPLSMNLIDCFHGVQVVDTRVKADFIHDDDASGFDTLLQCPNCRRDVACCNNMCVAFDSSFNDRNMERVRDKRDNSIDSCNSIVERRGISNVKRDSRRSRKALC
jgi:hypothetical protein